MSLKPKPQVSCWNEFCSVDDELDYEENESSNQIIGPHLPSEFSSSKLSQLDESEEKNNQKNIGPSLPNKLLPTIVNNDSVLKNDSDDEIIGPAMPPTNQTQEEVKEEFFNRLLLLEEAKKSEDESKKVKREKWMVELPEKLKQNYGLSAKSQFAQNFSQDSESSDLWTQTLNSDSKPSASKKSYIKTVDLKKIKPNLVEEKHESLVEIHQRKRKLNNKKNNNLLDEKNVRQPFNRDLDMEVRNFGNSEILKNSIEDISTRFQSSKSSKFL